MAHEAFLTDCFDALDLVDGESRRKLEYVIEQVMRGDREDGDVSLLIAVARDLIRKVKPTPVEA